MSQVLRAVPLPWFTCVAWSTCERCEPAPLRRAAYVAIPTAPPDKPKTLNLPLQQEARALRFAPAAARAVALRGAFCHGGHMCLVLQRLVPSLLDYVVDSAALPPTARLANLRALALQLLVRARER